jgi:hypothetical protein
VWRGRECGGGAERERCGEGEGAERVRRGCGEGAKRAGDGGCGEY